MHTVLHTKRAYPIRYLSKTIQACHSKVSCPFQPEKQQQRQTTDVWKKTLSTVSGSLLLTWNDLLHGLYNQMPDKGLSVLCWQLWYFWTNFFSSFACRLFSIGYVWLCHKAFTIKGHSALGTRVSLVFAHRQQIDNVDELLR